MRRLALVLAVMLVPVVSSASGILDELWWRFMVMLLTRDAGGWYGGC
jgi:hypothetical protein